PRGATCGRLGCLRGATCRTIASAAVMAITKLMNFRVGKIRSDTECERGLGQREMALKTWTHFAHRIDMLDAAGEIQEHLAGVEDSILAEALCSEAIGRWSRETIILQRRWSGRGQPPVADGEMNEGPLAWCGPSSVRRGFQYKFTSPDL